MDSTAGAPTTTSNASSSPVLPSSTGNNSSGNALPQAPAAASQPPPPAAKMIQLTVADVKKLMDAALRMQQLNQTEHPKYAQIVTLLRQYHQRRQAQVQQQQNAGKNASTTTTTQTSTAAMPLAPVATPSLPAATTTATAQQTRQLQLQQQLQRQQHEQQQQQQLLYQRQRQAQLHAQQQSSTSSTSTASPPAPVSLAIATHPLLAHTDAVHPSSTPQQQALALQTNALAPLIFSEKQLEHLHNQIRAYKALCHSMDEAVALSSTTNTIKPAVKPPSRVVAPPKPVVAPLLLTQRTPKWTRASRNLRFVGPACFDGDLLDVSGSKSALLMPLGKDDDDAIIQSPALGLSDWTLKKRYRQSLEAFLTTSLAALEPFEATLSSVELMTLRDLRCLVIQQKLRQTIHEAHLKQLALLGRPHAIDRRAFRRHRPSLRVDLQATDRQQRKATVALAKQQRADHHLYLKAVLTHAREFQSYHKFAKSQTAKAAKAVKAFVEQRISKAEREEDRQEKLRLKALKANDMDAYSKLVAEAKNERLTYLLGQTNSYLDSIRKLVRDHKRKHNVDVETGSLTTSTNTNDDDNDDDLNYLEIASKGELPRQPMMLIGGDLKEYQLRGLQWMVSLYDNHLNGILADEMGLGKTIQSISLLTYITEVKHNHGPFLVVVPLSTLSNWVNEFKKWAPDLVLVVYKGHPQVRKELYRLEMASCQFNVLLTTYEYIMKDKHVLRKYDWQYIIVDEGHRMKNAQSKFAMTLGTLYTSRNRLLLTGTPLQNSLPELWALLNFLLPTIFESVDTFEQWFSKPFSQFGAANANGANGSGTTETNDLSDEERMLIINRLHQVLRPFLLRRVKSSVLDQLPDKVERVLKCDLSGWQKILYRRIQEGGALLLETTDGGGDEKKAKNKAKYTSKGLSNVLMQLRKVCNHPYLFQANGYPIDFDIVRSSGKFELLDRMLPKLQAAGHRVLMFSQMTQLMHVLEDYFAYRGFRYLRLDGSTSADEREQRMFMFNAPDSPFFIFLLSTRAGGLGLNLATADTVIIFDSDWNPAMDAQAQDRAHRIGQKNEVRVFRLVTNSPVEEKILSRATDKMNMNNLVVEAGKFNNRSKEAERRAMLESLIKMESEEATQSNAMGDSDDAATVLLDDEINEMMALTDEELALYQKLDTAREKREAKEWVEHCKRLKQSAMPRPSRLMIEADVPQWLQDANAEIESDIASGKLEQANNPWRVVVGDSSDKAGRKRKDISYRDAFTDSEFVKMCEDGIDGNDDKKKTKSEKRKRGSSSRWSDDDDDDEEEEEDDAVVAAVGRRGAASQKTAVATAATRKTGVKRKAAALAVALPAAASSSSDSDDDVDAFLTSTNTDNVDEATRKTLCYAYRKVYDGVVKLTDSTGRLRAELYFEKPSAVDYPDYYTLITTPMDLATIKRRIDKHAYSSHASFEADWRLMVANAQLYNHPQSLVYYDAMEIDAFVQTQLRIVRQKTLDALEIEYVAAKQQHKLRSKAKRKEQHKQKTKRGKKE